MPFTTAHPPSPAAAGIGALVTQEPGFALEVEDGVELEDGASVGLGKGTVPETFITETESDLQLATNISL